MTLYSKLRPELVELIEGKKNQEVHHYDYTQVKKALEAKQYITELTVHELMCLNRVTDHAFLPNAICVKLFNQFYNQ